MSGAYNPLPLQPGAEFERIIELLQQGYESALGTALASEYGTLAWVENHATARVLSDLAKAAIRLGNQWNPEKMTDFLSRWEKILGIVPLLNATQNERRTEVALRLSLVGEPPTYQVVYDFLSELLGELFIGLVNTSSSEATTTINTISDGYTLSIPGGATIPYGDWRSSIAYLAVLVQKPDEMTDAEFYPQVGKIYKYLHILLPAWCTFDWIQDGPDGAGFYLDQDYNIDNMRLTIS